MNEETIIRNALDTSDLPKMDEAPVVEPTVLKEILSNPENTKVDVNDDYSMVRENLYHQVQMIKEMSIISLEEAKASPNAKNIEAFVSLMRQMTVTNKELLKMHVEVKEIRKEEPQSTLYDENGDVKEEFSCTTAELMTKFGTAQDNKDFDDDDGAE